MKSAIPVGFVERVFARRGRSAIVAAAAALMLVSPVAAQSPSPSAAPAGSVAPSTTPSTLAAIEAAFAAQACDPLLSAAEVASTTGVAVTGVTGGHVPPDSDRAGFIGLDCSWSVVDGGTIKLAVDESRWTGQKKPKAKDHFTAIELDLNPDATILAGLGDVAYSDPGSDHGQYPGRPNVAWAVWLKHGKAFADRQLTLVGEDIDIAVLESLAYVVRSNASPGDPPGATPPGDAAAQLLGSWTLSGLEGVSLFEEPPMMTATFDDTGRVTTTFDCKGFDGKKPVARTRLYFVEGDGIAMVADVEGGSEEEGTCFTDNGPPDTGQISLARAFDRISEATWTVDGDTFTLTGPDNAFEWTFDRAAG